MAPFALQRWRQFLRITIFVIGSINLIALISGTSLLQILKTYVSCNNDSKDSPSKSSSTSAVELISSTTLATMQHKLNAEIHDKLNPALSVQRNTDEKLREEQDEQWKLDNANLPELSVLTTQKKVNGPKSRSKTATCADFPDLKAVHFSNDHWQTQQTKTETYYLYSAFLDLRGENSSSIAALDNAKIRILAMADTKVLTAQKATIKVCQFWFANGSQPSFAKIVQINLLWKLRWGRKGHYYPYLITCPLPKDLKEVPISVSLVTRECESATNNLKIIHRERANQSLEQRTPQENFGVCVKPLDFPDGKSAPRLVEWVEMLVILGADKIFFYEYHVAWEIKKILNYYEELSVIDVVKTKMPGVLPNQPQLRRLYNRASKLDKRLTELIPYNDCLYRHMYDYKYLLIVDVDELILPTDQISWKELLDQVTKVDIGDSFLAEYPVSTYCFRNFHYHDEMMIGKSKEVADIPSELHMLRNIYRFRNSTGTGGTKCFHSTDLTAAVHNHLPFFCREGKLRRSYFVDVERGKMNHYGGCHKKAGKCPEYSELTTVKDESLWRYKNELIFRVQTVLALGRDQKI